MRVYCDYCDYYYDTDVWGDECPDCGASVEDSHVASDDE